MLLSNLSEKLLNTVSIEIKEDSLCIHEQLRKAHEAAQAFLPLLNKAWVDAGGGPHAATSLFAAAWLTGTSLCQSFRDQKSTLPIMPEDVNKAWEHLVYLLESYNFQKADIPVGRVVLAAMAAPHHFRPQVEMVCVQAKLQDQYHAVMKQHGFDTRGGAHVGVILCSLLIQEYSQAGLIDVDAATGVAAQGIFEAARQCILA